MPKRSTASPSAPTPKPTIEVVDPRWLLKAGALVLLAALACGYLTVCGLFYFGQWQFVLHPSAAVKHNPQDDALPTQAGQLVTDGAVHRHMAEWAVPSDSSADPVVLLLHGGDGNLGDTVPLIQLLHSARLSVFAFDYRGFGESDGPHPTERSMESDAEEAFESLARSTPASRVILAGQGLGASLAVRLAAEHPSVAAVILEQPDGDTAARVAREPRTKFIPVRLLMRDTFPLQAPLEKLSTPKLIITYRESQQSLDVWTAADPKMTVELATGDQASHLNSLRRFLDEYVARPVPSLLPAPASR